MEKVFYYLPYTIYADNKRHLITVPYTLEDLHDAAEFLEINRCWYHSTPYPHYDIPKRRVDEILNHDNVTVVSSKELLKIIKENL